MPMLRGEHVWLRWLEKADVSRPLDDQELAHYAGFKSPIGGEASEAWFEKL